MPKQPPVKTGNLNPLIFMHLFLAIGALISGALLMISPDGSLLKMPLSVMQNAPFKDFFIPGLILFIFLGIYPLFIAYSLWKLPNWTWPNLFNPYKQYHWSWTGSVIVGVIVVIWLLVELRWVTFGYLHVVYFVWAIMIMAITLNPGVRSYLRVKRKPVVKHK